MLEFSKNSSCKVLVYHEEDIKPIIELTDVPDWYASKFDVICTTDTEEVFGFLQLDTDVLTAFVTLSSKPWEEFAPFMKGLPYNIPAIRRRWVHVTDPTANIASQVIVPMMYKELETNFEPMFSVVVSLYNTKWEYLRELISSVQNQSYQDWELVLSDDTPYGIDKITFGLLNEHCHQDPRIKYYKSIPSNGNIGLAKWRANSFATGKWLFEMDHDDILPYWSLELHAEAANMYPDSGFLYSDTSDIDKNSNFIYGQYGEVFSLNYAKAVWIDGPNNKKIPTNTVADVNPETIRHIVGVPNHSRVWRKDIYYKIGGHSKTQRICDDYELLIRTFLETKFVHINYPCYFQRFDGNNTQEDNRKDIQRRVDIISKFYNDKIHNRIIELGREDYCYNKTRFNKLGNENIMNYQFNVEIN